MIDNLKKHGELYEDYSLEKNNTYGIKSSCKYFIKPYIIDNLVNLLNYLKKSNINYFLIGSGSNLILPDNKFSGVVISLNLINNIIIDEYKVTAEAGVLLNQLARKCINNNLSGFEYIATIPGTLGGALYGNAGVKDHEIYDTLESIDVIRDNKLFTLHKNDIKYSYRYSEFKDNNDIIVRASFNLTQGNKDEMESIVKTSYQKRIDSQPLEFKNAGSVFKNPQNNYAGKLIEEANLKGYKINDAEVSTKHANFIINKGNASSKDIKDLINYIKKEIHNKNNIDLELEQIVVEWD